MRVVFAQQEFHCPCFEGVFLAGPTYRARTITCRSCGGNGRQDISLTDESPYWVDCTACSVTGKETLRSWRQDALEIFEERGFAGDVYVPEFEGWGDFIREGIDSDVLWEKQVDWELRGLAKADVILFWVPRDLNLLPGFTTNVEFGMWVRHPSRKVVLGYPEGAPKMRYMNRMAMDHNVPVAATLSETIDAAIARLNVKHRHGDTGDIDPPKETS